MVYLFEYILLYWAVTWFFFCSQTCGFSPITLQVGVLWNDSCEWPQAVFLFNCYKLDFVNARTTEHFLQFGLCNNILFEHDVLVMWICYPKHHLFNELTCTLHWLGAWFYCWGRYTQRLSQVEGLVPSHLYTGEIIGGSSRKTVCLGRVTWACTQWDLLRDRRHVPLCVLTFTCTFHHSVQWPLTHET